MNHYLARLLPSMRAFSAATRSVYLGGICSRALHIFFLATAAAIQAVPEAHAYTQGRLGRTSSASVTITLTKHLTVNIVGVSDMAATPANTGSGITWTNDLCVYSGHPAAGYRIVATGSPGAGGAFLLSNGARTLPYRVAWNAGGVGNLSNSGALLTPGVPSPPLGNAAPELACLGGNGVATARLIVSMPQPGIGPGSYTDSLTLLVAPN